MRMRIRNLLLIAVAAGVMAITANAQEAAVGYAGTWGTVTDKDNKFMVTLRHRRSVVGGRYESPDGKIKGTLSGTVKDGVLRFTWRQEGAQGAGRFTLTPNGRAFNGTFSSTTDPDNTSGGTWNGTRKQ